MIEKKKRGRPRIFEGVDMSDVSLRLPTEFVDDISRQSLESHQSVSSVLRSVIQKATLRKGHLSAALGSLRRAMDKAKAEAQEITESLQMVLLSEYVWELIEAGWEIEIYGTAAEFYGPYAHYNGRGEFTTKSGHIYLMPVLTEKMLDQLGLHRYTSIDELAPSIVAVIGKPIRVGRTKMQDAVVNMQGVH
jgi:Arc/MetJ-type ribon-helix-helix transcriptional regulator